MKYALLMLAVLVGGLAPLQGAINSRLGGLTGQPLLATAISFTSGWLTIALVVCLASGGLPKFPPSGSVPFYLFLGGVPGVVLVLTALWMVPKLGVAMTLSGLIVGQLCVSLAFDRFGWLGLSVRELSPQRLVGVALHEQERADDEQGDGPPAQDAVPSTAPPPAQGDL